MKNNIAYLGTIYEKVIELNRKNNLLKAKYQNDTKYTRIHKRILEKGNISKKESAICETLLDIKKTTDDKVLINRNILTNESYFEGLVRPTVIQSFSQAKINLDVESTKYINNLLVKEYINEYEGVIG